MEKRKRATLMAIAMVILLPAAGWAVCSSGGSTTIRNNSPLGCRVEVTYASYCKESGFLGKREVWDVGSQSSPEMMPGRTSVLSTPGGAFSLSGYCSTASGRVALAATCILDGKEAPSSACAKDKDSGTTTSWRICRKRGTGSIKDHDLGFCREEPTSPGSHAPGTSQRSK